MQRSSLSEAENAYLSGFFNVFPNRLGQFQIGLYRVERREEQQAFFEPIQAPMVTRPAYPSQPILFGDPEPGNTFGSQRTKTASVRIQGAPPTQSTVEIIGS
jgi:hypothetical protein